MMSLRLTRITEGSDWQSSWRQHSNVESMLPRAKPRPTAIPENMNSQNHSSQIRLVCSKLIGIQHIVRIMPYIPKYVLLLVFDI